MPGLWKAWKAKGGLPPLSTSPLEISPKGGKIPTFPQLRRRRRWESGKPKAGFPLSHRLEYLYWTQRRADRGAGFALRPRRRFARLSGPLFHRRGGKLSLRPWQVASVAAGVIISWWRRTANGKSIRSIVVSFAFGWR